MRFILLLSWLFIGDVCADTFRCESITGELLYTDRNCVGEDWQQAEITVIGVQEKSPVGLSGDEIEALEKLSKRLRKERQSRAVHRDQKVRQKQRQEVTRKQNCHRAKQGLSEIREQRRHGYELADRKNLDRKTSEFRKTLKTDC